MKFFLSALLGWLFSFCAFAADYRIQHLEPANWWVGMRHHQVQLMVHGNKIAELAPRIQYSGVNVVAVERVSNPNYLFVTIDIEKQVKPGKFPIEFLAGSDVKTSFDYELMARAKNSATRQGFNTSDAIYLITPDRFANGNEKNDVVNGMADGLDRASPGGRHGGDIAGMVKYLDYIKQMGFTQIWPNPLVENNQSGYSYHGYAATNNYLIDARYGTNEEFKKFVAKANSKGIGVIQDIILNHIGSQHWWMDDLPMEDWLNYQSQFLQGQYQITNHRRTAIQDPYAADADRESFVSGWFSKGMPDLNQRNPFVATYLIQNTLWWIEYAGLSGVREDTYGYADQHFLSNWARAVMEEYPNFNIVGEEWSINPNVVAHWQRGKQNASGHVPYMPSVFDFPIYDALRLALLEDEGWDSGLIRLYEALANDFVYPDPFSLVVFPENHDTSRIYSYLHEDVDLFKMAMVYMATIRGIPQFFYGSEVLMTSPRERDDGAVRADMPGGWPGDKKNAFTGKGLSKEELNAQAYIKKLLNWRKNATVIHKGKLKHFAPIDGVYTYFRYDEKNTVMVVLNKNSHEISLSLNRFESVIGAKLAAKDVMYSVSVDLSKPLVLPAKSARIIEIR